MSYENDVAEELAAYRSNETYLKNAINEKSKLYFSVAILTIVSYIVSMFTPEWVRWIALFFIAGQFAGQWGMNTLLNNLRVLYLPHGNNVVGNHLMMGWAALLLLAYAFTGLLGYLPVPWLALAISIVINLLHGIGFAPKTIDVHRR